MDTKRYELRLAEADEYLINEVAPAEPAWKSARSFDVQLDPELVARYQSAQRELRAAGQAIYKRVRDQIED